MAYKLEHIMSDHIGVLVGTMQKWGNSQPDLYMISEEGHKIYTQRLLVCFYSSTLADIMTNCPQNDMPGISVPASSNSIVNLLKVLATGIAISNCKEDLNTVSKTAESMGIDIENWQIGVKNKAKIKSSPILSKDQLKKMNVMVKSKSNGPSELCKKEESIKKHICLDCGKAFGRKDHLKAHAETHSASMYPCETCGSVFKRKQGLRLHLSKAHGLDLVEDNDIVTNIKTDIVTNIKTETGVSENDIPDVTSVSNELDDQSMMGSDSKLDLEDNKYSCSTCGKRFNNGNHLRRHEVIHTGAKLFCNYCEAVLSRKDKLNAHIRKKHPEELNDQSIMSEITDMNIEAGESRNESPDSEELNSVETTEEVDDENNID